MTRYYHYLQPLKRKNWPQVICCVSLRTRRAGDEEQLLPRHQQLLGWQVWTMVRGELIYRVSQDRSGSDVEGFWSALVELTSSFRNVWIMSYDCAAAWSLLEFWGMMEDGRISLWGSDPRMCTPLCSTLPQLCSEPASRAVPGDGLLSSGMSDVRGLVSPGRTCESASGRRIRLESRQGYLVLEDPPLVACFRLAGHPTRYTWVDARNYAGTSAAPGEPADTSAAALAVWVMRATATLSFLGFGGLGVTTAATAWTGYRLGYYRGGIYCHDHPEALRLERAGYYGGRVSALAVGDCGPDVYQIDFHSFYPTLCASALLPVRLATVYGPEFPVADLAGKDGLGVIAECLVQTDEPAYPRRMTPQEYHLNRPQRAAFVGDIHYPVGRFWTVLCGPELLDAVSRGRILRVRSAACYEMEVALAEYMQRLLYERAVVVSNGDRQMAAWVKGLANAIVGKLGQTDRAWIPTDPEPGDPYYGSWFGGDGQGGSTRYRSVAGHVMREQIGGPAADAVPAIAAWVTSLGRCKLLDAIRVVGWHNVYYMDTDSLFLTEEGYGRFRQAAEAAGAADRGDHAAAGPAQFRVAGPKVYAFGPRTVCAGYPHGASRGFRGDSGAWAQRRILTQLASGVRPERYTLPSAREHPAVRLAALPYPPVRQVHPILQEE